MPPYSYQWDNGVTIGEIHNLTPGIYGVTVTDANDCSVELSLAVNFITAVEDLEVITKINVFPNPKMQDDPLNVMLNSPIAQNIQVQIFSILGKKVVDRKEKLMLGENKLTINLSLSGIYFLTIIDENGNQVIRKVEIL